jgi:ATP-dependent Clp protease ATP-binding subunit ClpC
MFERFTDRARRAVVLAQEESRFFNHSYIGTEHLLLGLLREEEGVAARTLTSVGLTLEGVQSAVEARVGRGREGPKGHIPFTPRAKKVLELALREALKLGHNYIGTEHVLLGLLTEGEGVAAQIMLTDVEGGLERVTDEVMAALVEAGSVTRGEQTQRSMRMRMAKSLGRSAITIGSSSGAGDEVVKRLEAIEARLSAIERMLREQRGGEEVV